MSLINCVNIKVKQTDIYSLILIVLIFLNQVLITFFAINYGTYVLFVLFLGIFLVNNKVYIIKNLVYFLILPNKYLQLGGCLLFAIVVCTRNIAILRQALLTKESFAFFVVSASTTLINIIYWQGQWFNMLFQLGFYAILFVLIFYFREYEINMNQHFMKMIVYMELIMGALQFIKIGQGGDNVSGTFVSAHWYGVFITVYIYTYVIIARDTNPKKVGIFSKIEIISMILMLYLSDAKHVYICFLLAVVADFLLNKIKIHKKWTFSLLLICAAIGLLVPVLTWFSNKVNINPLISSYILNPEYNKKYSLASKMLKQLMSLNGVFGFGLGQYGSQICLTMAKEIIYPWRYANTIYHFAAMPYKEAIDGLMTSGYTLYGIKYSSMVLGYPLVSIFPLIAENGIVGLILLGRAMEKLLGNYKNCTLLIMLVLLFVFDTYFEIPCVTVLILLFQSIINNQSSKRIINHNT